MFQSPRSGQICSNKAMEAVNKLSDKLRFQSPRSGQICLNRRAGEGKFLSVTEAARFNPLDRVKFVQIYVFTNHIMVGNGTFQSPRSGQICLNNKVWNNSSESKVYVSIP